MHAGPRPPLTRRLRHGHWVALDALVALALTVLTWLRVMDGYHNYDVHHRGYAKPSAAALVVVLAAVVVVGLAIALRRSHQLAAGGAVLAGWAALAIGAGHLTIAMVAGPQVVVAAALVVYITAATQPRRTGLIMLGIALAGAWLSIFGSAELQGNATMAALIPITAWAIGYSMGQRRAYTAELHEHQASLAHAELTEERMRIARELHDVIAHSMSVVNVQAGYGHFVLDSRPAEARAALAAIQATSSDTIKELRGLLGVLREEVPDLSPAPCLADVDRLVTRTAEAGVRVSLSITGTPRELPAGLEQAAYRIVQEALTNVVKHADTSAARVVIEYRTDELSIEITDGGRGGPATPGGHGLAGMRERASLYNGRFSAGPLPGHGWQVSATLPVAP